ncbi:MAG: 50S ribosomal protein L6 [Chlamydiae bacterium]|jgi:large subunit ribosomal protein L6|nr:50S ribosomal protein L6 [Chlamydiota bacterium]
MSRLGKSPIPLPKNVELKVQNGELQVKGPKGTLKTMLPAGITITVDADKVVVIKDEAVELPKTAHGFYRATINNMIVGVSSGFEKKLTLIGVGYRATVQGSVLDLQLGFSHPTQVKIPPSVKVLVDKSTAVSITGIDKQEVGQFAAVVRSMRPPEPYKGKGIRYEGEYVRKKAGKAAKGKAG